MGVLDSVMRMKGEGNSEQQIIQTLRSQGVPPKQIQDALSQSQIKQAVSGSDYQEPLQESIMNQNQEYADDYDDAPMPYPEGAQGAQPPMDETMMPQNYAQDSGYQDAYQDPYYGAQQPYAPQDYAPQDYGTQDNYLPEEYGGYGTTAPQQESSTMIDLAEQVVAEKTKRLDKTIQGLKEFQTLAQSKLTGMDERLKRLETTIDQLQISILDKIGSFGQNVNAIKKEMAMMQDSFSKVIDPLLDKRK